VAHVQCSELRKEGRKGGREGGREKGRKEGRKEGRGKICFGCWPVAHHGRGHMVESTWRNKATHLMAKTQKERKKKELSSYVPFKGTSPKT
jgi:predicted transposase YdaD